MDFSHDYASQFLVFTCLVTLSPWMLSYRDTIFCFGPLSNVDFYTSSLIMVNLWYLDFTLLRGIYFVLIGESVSSGPQCLLLRYNPSGVSMEGSGV